MSMPRKSPGRPRTVVGMALAVLLLLAPAGCALNEAILDGLHAGVSEIATVLITDAFDNVRGGELP